MRSRRYGSDLTDAQWEAIAPLFDHLHLHRHRPRTVLDALFYVVKGGNQWRQLPDSFPPWQSVYYHFGRWVRTGLLDRVHALLRRLTRLRAGREPTPSAAVVDAQSVKTSTQGGVRGFDGGKLVKGRKRHVLVDTLGLIWAVLVHSAGVNDSQRAPHLLDRVQGLVPRLELNHYGLKARRFGSGWKPQLRLKPTGSTTLEARHSRMKFSVPFGPSL